MCPQGPTDIYIYMCIYMYRGLPPWPLAGPAYFLGLVFWRRTWTPDERLYSLEEASGSVSGCFWSDASATQLLAYWPRHGGSGDHKHPTSKTPSVSMLKFHFGTITDDMQDKYCGNCYDIYLIQSQCKGNHRKDAAAVRPRHLFCGGGQRPAPLYWL